MGEVKKRKEQLKKEAERVTDRFEQDPMGTIVGGGTSTFVAPAPPAPPPLPGFPTEQDTSKALEADAEMQDKIRRSRRGRSSTILTGAKGLAPIEEGGLARKTLLA
jgi:hypothetical protein